MLLALSLTQLTRCVAEMEALPSMLWVDQGELTLNDVLGTDNSERWRRENEAKIDRAIAC